MHNPPLVLYPNLRKVDKQHYNVKVNFIENIHGGWHTLRGHLIRTKSLNEGSQTGHFAHK